MTKLKHLTLAAATTLIAGLAAAAPIAPGVYSLQSGSTLHVFDNGKMGMENAVGFAVFMDEGTPMTLVDGRQVNMKGNEVARVSQRVRPADN